MDLRIEWMNILMVLGSAVGGVLAALLFAITKNEASLWLFVLGLSGGAFLGWFIEYVLCRTK